MKAASENILTQDELTNEGHKKQKREYDYLSAHLNIEYLPGYRLEAPVSIRFTDEEVAELSIKHIQEKYPEVKLVSVTSYLDKDEDSEYWERLERERKHTEYLKEKFLSN